MSTDRLLQAVVFLIALLISLDVHEFMHAYVALRMGDPTAKYMGRVTLNPIAHLDPLGTVMMLFMAFSGVGIGWGKPVPVNPNNLRRGPIVGEALVSVCGPLSNLLLAAIVAVPLRLAIMGILPRTLIAQGNVIGYFLIVLLSVNISLAVFNLLPIFPLDGYHFWLGLLHEIPTRFTRQLWVTLSGGALMQAGPMLLLLLIIVPGGILGRIMAPIANFFSVLLVGVPLF
jgi:Zn-dependent protease